MSNRRRKTQARASEVAASEDSEANHEETMEETSSASATASTEAPAVTSKADLRRKKTRLLRDLRNGQNKVYSLIESGEVTASQVSQICSEMDKAIDELLELISRESEEEDDDMWEEFDAIQQDVSKTIRLANKSVRSTISAALDKQSSDANRELEEGATQSAAHETETIHPSRNRAKDSSETERNRSAREPRNEERARVDWAEFGLKRPQLPVFSGEPNKYEDWRATFDAFVSIEKIPGKFKMMQLKNCLTGDALKLVDRYRPSDNGFMKAMEELERKYGGISRRIRYQLEEIRNIKPVRPGATRDLEELADRVQSLVTNLEEYGSAGDLSDVSAYYILAKEKLHVTFLKSYRRWIQGQNEKDSFKTFAAWLTEEAQYEQEAIAMSSASQMKRGETEFAKKPKRTWNTKTQGSSKDAERRCPYCEQEHWLPDCPLFKKWTVGSRYHYCKTKRICFRCLAGVHRGTNCRRFPGCQVTGCGGSHHTLLHAARQDASPEVAQSPTAVGLTGQEQSEVQLNHRSAASATQKSNRVVFQTVPVKVKANERCVVVNALLDPCSDACFMTDAASKELGLHGEEEQFELGTVNGSSRMKMTKAEVEVCSTREQFRTNIGVYIIKDLSGASTKIDWNMTKHKWNHLRDVPFPNVSRRQGIDMLIGLTDTTTSLFIPLETRQGEAHEPVGVKTPLGWTAFGPVGDEDKRVGVSKTLRTHVSAYFQDEINAMHAMTDLELIGVRNENENIISYEEKIALEKAHRSLKHDGERYEVAVPWRQDRPGLSGNFGYALSRLKKTEQSLMKSEDKTLLAKYSATFEEYVSKGYMKKMKLENAAAVLSNCWFLPHFPVIREDRATTKIRVVYDAAAKFQGRSLNEELYPGPSICNNLIEVLLGFRRHAVALTGDVAEMFLQVKLTANDRKFHRVLWRDGESEREPDIYEAQRWLFGNAAAPFAAQFVMKENAKQHATRFPLASEAIENAFYMDDALVSYASEDEAKKARKQLTELMKLAGMKIRKWRSSSSAVMDSVAEEDRAEEPCFVIDEWKQAQAKALGVAWNAEEDTLSIASSTTSENFTMKPTKRIILKTMAAIFDPLCMLCPFTVRSKILFQETWSRGLQWDDELPLDMKQKWAEWTRELQHLSSISVPRCIHRFSDITEQKLHVFTDASEQAYAAAVYVVTASEDEKASNLALARVRVTPRSRKVSIPRLELMAALLGLRLVKKACTTFKILISEVKFWSDSINVLCWIRNDVRQFQPFVAHRISEIREVTDPEQWQHVPGSQNPADMPSRGVKLDTLKYGKMWWNGPPFLTGTQEDWPVARDLASESFDRSEMKQTKTSHATRSDSPQADFRLHPRRFSSWLKLVKVTAWVFRFIDRLKKRTRGQRSSKASADAGASLDTSEVSSAETFWLIRAQECYDKERSQLQKQKKVSSADKERHQVFKCSSIKSLCPFLDDNGLLRVGGRLQRSALPFAVKHPVLLPKGHHVTRLVVRQVHEEGDHELGIEHSVAELRQRFWIVSAREEVKRCIRSCPECIKRRQKPEKQLMGPKTEAEVRPSGRAFSICAVDFAGPFETKQGRGKVRTKRYLCVFLCLQSRAVHLEIVFGLDTDSFLCAFLRFVARRGRPSEVISDNAKNFVGASRELAKLVKKLNQDVIREKTAHLYIAWKFIPPGAPHFNGSCEAMVKSAKRALRRTLEQAHLSDEELMTAFCRVEALLNSRPLTAVSSDPLDAPPLTPAAFLLGHIDLDVSSEDADTAENTRRRWRRLQQLSTEFWRRWMREYLPSLQARQKWTEETRTLRVGELVLVADASVPRGSWPLARVSRTFPGQDGLVRVVEVSTPKGAYKRPITKIVRLEMDM